MWVVPIRSNLVLGKPAQSLETGSKKIRLVCPTARHDQRLRKARVFVGHARAETLSSKPNTPETFFGNIFRESDPTRMLRARRDAAPRCLHRSRQRILRVAGTSR